jgi:hypothetical protein
VNLARLRLLFRNANGCEINPKSAESLAVSRMRYRPTRVLCWQTQAGLQSHLDLAGNRTNNQQQRQQGPMTHQRQLANVSQTSELAE